MCKYIFPVFFCEATCARAFKMLPYMLQNVYFNCFTWAHELVQYRELTVIIAIQLIIKINHYT